MPKLSYIGDGSFIPNIPARDLDLEELQEIAVKFLVGTGLYKEVAEPKPKPGKSQAKESK